MAIAIIYILSEETEHRPSADSIATKLAGKADKYTYGGGGVPILVGGKQLCEFLSGPTGTQVVKIHLMAHGNWEIIQGKRSAMTPDMLALHLWACGLKELFKSGKRSIKISLLTCQSGAEHPDDRTIYAQQLATHLRTLIGGGAFGSISIRGCDGLSFTTTDGHNRVAQPKSNADADTKALERLIKNANGDLAKLRAGLRAIQARLLDTAVARPTF